MRCARVTAMRFFALALGVTAITLASGSAESPQRTVTFPDPIDGISIALPAKGATADVRYATTEGWSAWQTLSFEDEQYPSTRESQLFLFPASVSRIEVSGDGDIHPIRISSAPASYQVAATGMTVPPRVLKRRDWGADDSLLWASGHSSSGDASGERENGESPENNLSGREQDCLDAQRAYPKEFQVERTVKTDDGRTLRWPRQYSKTVRLLVLHPPAAAVGGDDRSGVERVRAIEQYHAQNRGWGDVGYHYLIDEDGRIYEGKAGGDKVVGGHAYCHNISSVGIALLGNFEVERPTQTQMKSLQWLLDDLADHYAIDVSRDVSYHGKILPAIVGHGDLLSTDCPGYYVDKTLSQVRANVRNNELSKTITFPAAPAGQTSSRRSTGRSSTARSAITQPTREGISAFGETKFTGRPGAQFVFSLRFTAGTVPPREGSTIATVTRSDETIGLWQEIDGKFERVRDAIVLPKPIPTRGTMQLRLKAQFPSEQDRYFLHINGIPFVLEAKGRRQPLPRGTIVPADAFPHPPRSRSSLSAR